MKLCKFLGINRDVYYYKSKEKEVDEELIKIVKSVFLLNKSAYGQKKMYKALRKKDVSIGKEKLAKIMKEEKLVSKYTRRRKPKNAENTTNSAVLEDEVGRDFNNKKPLEVVVSDLTYVDINEKWHYICLLIELSHREIIGHAAGENKDAELVKNAWLSVKQDIREIGIFHTDRGGEFANETIDKILEIGKIKRSLSRPGTPVDNAVCESMYDIVKTEFIFEEKFTSSADLQAKLDAWVWWYNNERIHSSLSYKSPVESRQTSEIGATTASMANKKYQNFWKKIATHQQKVKIDS